MAATVLRTNDDVEPLDPAQVDTVLDDVLVRGQQDLEVARPEVALQALTLRGVTLVRDRPHAWRPLSELARPVGHRRERYDNEVRAALFLGLDEERDERDCLDSLAETLSPTASVLGH